MNFPSNVDYYILKSAERTDCRTINSAKSECQEYHKQQSGCCQSEVDEDFSERRDKLKGDEDIDDQRRKNIPWIYENYADRNEK